VARGFESKAVADQQEASGRERPAAARALEPPELAKRRKGLELGCADLRRRLESARVGAYRLMLQRALADLERQLTELTPPGTGTPRSG
jgi:hypothetical protein